MVRQLFFGGHRLQASPDCRRKSESSSRQHYIQLRVCDHGTFVGERKGRKREHIKIRMDGNRNRHCFYILIGLLGAWAFDFAANQDLLDVIVLHSTGPLRLISRICVYLFPAAALLSSIPVFSIIIRYNLTDNGIVKRKIIANWWSVIFPWILGVVVYTGSGVISVINWTSLFVNGVVNFVIPLILYILSNRIPYEDEKRPIDINDGQEDRIALLKDKPTTYFKALPDRKWLNHNAVAYTLIVVITLFLLAVIVTDFVYLGLGVNLVG
eukprot:TRINITY_DN4539_c0_g1_i3.p2 TRINITY_DN4539_c0_g1~~TRINITY_DN4539_c0_g1_i3.p2  ORF type:complete len:268 (+),score=46.01 TRINITY_DN4539_c0_g1_i3:658-1461(+)